MKTRNLLTLLLLIFCAGHLFATDRVVQLSGPGGTYGSISAAITAAADGDNIVINNRTDLLPWVENLTINKSLTFVSAVDNIQWWMEGTITIAMAEGRIVNIIGLKNSLSTGHITKTGSNPVNRTVVNIMASEITGNVTMGTGINFHMGSTKANFVTFSYGKVIGNDLRSLDCIADAVSTEDVNLVIGNRIGYPSPTTTGYNHSSATQYLFFSNNFVRGSSIGVNITALKSGATVNRIINCHTAASNSSSSSIYFGMSLNHTSGDLTVENCVLSAQYNSSTTGSNGLNMSSTAATLTTLTYNMYYNPYAGATTPNSAQGNFPSSWAEYDNIDANGSLISGNANTINAGNPLNQFLDLDLTRNDVGVTGGSYSMANFIPLINNPESSRVNYVNTPRIVYQGNTMNVQVIGFDK